MIEERHAVMILCGLPGLGPVRIGRLLERFENASSILVAGSSELRAVRDIGGETAGVIASWQKHFDLDHALKRLEEENVSFVLKDESGYPRNLATLPDAPLGLYIKGRFPESRGVVAIIGTRRPTLYGRAIARRFGSELTRAGMLVASGMARGVDTEAHEGSLLEGPTVAVLGSGIDVIYPKENRDLYHQIAEKGAVISEFPMGRQPDVQTFPQRNRLVSGMSDGVLVVESDIRGGSMITARFAADQGRHVFALPGRVDQPAARGCHALIRDGATLVTTSGDIIDDLRPMQLPLELFGRGGDSHETTVQEGSSQLGGLSEDERAVAQTLVDGSLLIPDQIGTLTGLPHQTLGAALMMLELKRKVAKHPDGRYEWRN